MIPSEVADIADVMMPGWRDDVLADVVLKMAWRLYNAGFRKIDPKLLELMHGAAAQ